MRIHNPAKHISFAKYFRKNPTLDVLQDSKYASVCVKRKLVSGAKFQALSNVKQNLVKLRLNIMCHTDPLS